MLGRRRRCYPRATVAFAAWLLASALVDDGSAPSRDASGDGGIELRWIAPGECPKAADVRARLQLLLGDREPSAPFVRLDATVTRGDGTLTLEMRTETPSGTSSHTLSSPDCRALADGAALVAAVAADPLAVDRALAPADDAPPPLPPDEVTVTVAPGQPKPPRPRGRLRLARFALRADGVLEQGTTPRLGLGPIITVGLIGPRWRAELGTVVLAGRPHFTDDTETTGATFGRWGLRARGCGVPVVRIVEFPLCAGFEGGQITARPLGDTSGGGAQRRGFGLFSLGGGIGLSPRPFIAILAGVDGLVALTQPRFDVAGVALHQPSRVGVRATLGLELRVP